MEWTSLTALLAIVTLLSGVLIAVMSKRKVVKRMDDRSAPKSTLAKDKASDGKPADV